MYSTGCVQEANKEQMNVKEKKIWIELKERGSHHLCVCDCLLMGTPWSTHVHNLWADHRNTLCAHNNAVVRLWRISDNSLRPIGLIGHACDIMTYKSPECTTCLCQTTASSQSLILMAANVRRRLHMPLFRFCIRWRLDGPPNRHKSIERREDEQERAIHHTIYHQPVWCVCCYVIIVVWWWYWTVLAVLLLRLWLLRDKWGHYANEPIHAQSMATAAAVAVAAEDILFVHSHTMDTIFEQKDIYQMINNRFGATAAGHHSIRMPWITKMYRLFAGVQQFGFDRTKWHRH